MWLSGGMGEEWSPLLRRWRRRGLGLGWGVMGGPLQRSWRCQQLCGMEGDGGGSQWV